MSIEKKSLIKSRTATKKALIASRPGTKGSGPTGSKLPAQATRLGVQGTTKLGVQGTTKLGVQGGKI